MFKKFNIYSGYLALAVSSAALGIAINNANRDTPEIDYTQINQQFNDRDTKAAKMQEALAAAEEEIASMRLAYDEDNNEPVLVDLAGRPILINAKDMYEATKNLPKTDIDDADAIDPDNVRIQYDPETGEFSYEALESQYSQQLFEGKKPQPRYLKPPEIVD